MAEILMAAIYYFAWLLKALIVVGAIMSWLPIDRSNPFVQLLYALTEPILGPIRSLLRRSPFGGPGMMIDFSPIIAYFIIELVSNLLIAVVSR